MANYSLEFPDGRITDITADNDMDALRAALDVFGEDAVVADLWRRDGVDDGGGIRERRLIWDCGSDTDESPARLTVVRRETVVSG